MDDQVLKNELDVIKNTGDISIISPETFQAVSNNVIAGKALRKKIVDYFESMKTPAYAAWKAICKRETEMLQPTDAYIEKENKKVKIYLTEQERIRQAEQARVDEARRQQEQSERDKLNARADKAAEKGKEERAEVLRQKAEDVYIPPVIVQPAVEKSTKTDAGTISSKKDIDVTITDPIAILRGIIAGMIPISVVEISESKLKKHIQVFALKTLDGCTIEEVVKASFRGNK